MSEDDSDEDWFEKALEEDEDGEGDSDTTADGSDTTTAFDSDAAFGDDDGDESGVDGEPDADTVGDSDDAGNDSAFGGGDTEEGDAFDSESAADAFGGDTEDDGPFGDSDDTEDDSAFGGDDTEEGDTFDSEPDDGPFGGGGGGSDDSPFGDDDGELFEDDFASAFDSGGGEFEDEEFESAIPRIDLGIEGLDDMIQGGVPQRHLMTTIGSAGTGKTTFGLQFLHHGLENGDNGVFITLEQSRETIVETANERGWDFDHYEDEDMLAVVDLDPVEMANSLDNIRGELPELIKDFDADRLVLDSVSLLEMMYDNQARRRTEVFDFTRSLKQAGVTTFLTSEASESNPYASRHGIIEYLVDAVFILQYVRAESRETRLAVEIQKIRNANHSREAKPYDITMDGISVYQQANIF